MAKVAERYPTSFGQSNRKLIEHGILRLLCVQGAPQSSGTDGAEIERMEDPRSRVARTVEGPPKGNNNTAKQTLLAHRPGSLHKNQGRTEVRLWRSNSDGCLWTSVVSVAVSTLMHQIRWISMNSYSICCRVNFDGFRRTFKAPTNLPWIYTSPWSMGSEATTSTVAATSMDTYGFISHLGFSVEICRTCCHIKPSGLPRLPGTQTDSPCYCVNFDGLLWTFGTPTGSSAASVDAPTSINSDGSACSHGQWDLGILHLLPS